MGTNHIFEHIFEIFGTFIFISAVSLLIFFSGIQRTGQNELNKTIYDTNVMYMQYSDKEKTENTITYADLCAMLFERPEQNIMIIANGNLYQIHCKNFKYNSFDYNDPYFQEVKADVYEVEYGYNEDGSIASVVFRGK